MKKSRSEDRPRFCLLSKGKEKNEERHQWQQLLQEGVSMVASVPFL